MRNRLSQIPQYAKHPSTRFFNACHATLFKSSISTCSAALNKLQTIRAPHTPTSISTKLPTIAQGVRGDVFLFTGDFRYFTKTQAAAIAASLKQGQVYVLLFDKDSIAVPANERALWILNHFNHSANLEVRVAYGAPSEVEAKDPRFIQFIQQQLPTDIKIIEVNCANEYSKKLADALGCSWRSPITNQVSWQEHEFSIQHHPLAHKTLLHAKHIKRIFKPFTEAINERWFHKQIELATPLVEKYMRQANKEHPNHESLFSRVPWDLSALKQINLPIKIAPLQTMTEKQAFNSPLTAQVFDMPFYMPEQGYKIPQELAPYVPFLAKCVAAEALANPKIKHYNAYVTIDCGVVAPQAFARRQGLHLDGFLTSANRLSHPGKTLWGDNTYIMSSQKELMTEFYPGPFDLSYVDTDSPQAVLDALASQGKHMSYIQGDAYCLYRMNTNNVHAVHPNLTGTYLLRTFMKVTFSERLFNRSGNTINPLLNYRYTYIPRQHGRNTQNFTGQVPTGYLDVSLKEIDIQNKRYPKWITTPPLIVHKKITTQIAAYAATAGDYLETRVNGHVITFNTAREGDMKVVRTANDCYFLSGEKFHRLYQPATNAPSQYIPRKRKLTAMQTLKNISFIASWGTRQNIPAGGYLVCDDHGEIWGVHEVSFNATYKCL